MVDGELRPLHLEKASEVIAYGEKPEISTEEGRENIESEGAIIQELIRGEYFSIDKIKVVGKYQDKVHKSFTVLSILEGTGIIVYNNKEYPFKKGDTYFIPANLLIEINGKTELLKSYI
jgi:mannose-6-phosphate isomerase